ncbi:hypothetical protein [Acidovorax sp.]|uniref:hypothetical protein n=1 Tax=Acidovorax sp. TaxID=1872122 RepID=UPI0025C2013B|nr:hypothetical protein [Acidovorax sp.]MBL7091107.1 hypothetical protein [Acidovorax sp.]
MRKLTCFVIIPSNRGENRKQPVALVRDDKWGWVELPSGCQVQNSNDMAVDFDGVYEHIIKAAIDQVNDEYRDKQIYIECTRGQDLPEAGDIVRQLIEQICTADITITDITGHNPNVFLEHGIRLSVKDSLNILIRLEGVALPFNIEQLRCISYTLGLGGPSKAKKEIVSFIRSYLDKLDDDKKPVESSSFYKGYVEIHSGRQLERKLIGAFENAPKLVADFIQFLLINGTSLHLKQESFKFLEAIEKVLQEDPSGQQRAIRHLGMVSNIKGLSTEKLQDIYYRLWLLCDADDTLKEKGQYYLRKVEELEGN